MATEVTPEEGKEKFLSRAFTDQLFQTQASGVVLQTEVDEVLPSSIH